MSILHSESHFHGPTSLGPGRRHHFSHDVFSTQEASDWISTVRLIRPGSNFRHSDDETCYRTDSAIRTLILYSVGTGVLTT